MSAGNMYDRNSNANRLEQAKTRFIEILEDMDAWLDEAREDTFCDELFDFSLRAAELAAILGFNRPPFEHVLEVSYEAYGTMSDIREQAQATTICFNTPNGMSACRFGFPPPITDALMSQCNNRLHVDMRFGVRRWKRAVERLDVAKAKPATTSLILDRNSFEETIFEEQHKRALAGNMASFVDDSLKQTSEGLRLAKVYGLSPERTQELFREMGRAAAMADPGPVELAESVEETERNRHDEPSEDTVGSVGVEPGFETRQSLRERAENHVKTACNGIFPGVRKRARVLGCERRLSSLVNAIGSSTYLSARKAEYDKRRQGRPREETLTEVHLDQRAQSTEPDPAETLDELIDEQAVDLRNDQRATKRRVRNCSR